VLPRLTLHLRERKSQASLKITVLRAGHPAPDRLVWLTASMFPTPRLEGIKPLLLATKLTVDDVCNMLDLLRDGACSTARGPCDLAATGRLCHPRSHRSGGQRDHR
jgi:hypothetical protein